MINREINHALIAACRERGVKVYELQHGVMHVDGYKQGTQYDEQIDPHGFLTFGERWNRFIWGVPEDAVKVIGYRYIWQQRERQRQSGQAPGDAVMPISEPGCWQQLAGPFSEIVTRHPDKQFILKLHPQDIDDWPSRYIVGLAETSPLLMTRPRTFITSSANAGRWSGTDRPCFTKLPFLVLGWVY